MITCSRGCGQDATYQTKNGRWLCHRNPGKCPSCSSMGKPRKEKTQPVPYIGSEICHYGCGQIARYKTKSGKLHCQSQSANCPSIRAKAGDKISKSKFIEVEPGVTLGQKASRKASVTKSTKVVDGVNAHTAGACRAAETKRNKIDPQTNLNVHQMTKLKYKEWLKTAEGQHFIQKMSAYTSMLQNIVHSDGQKEAVKRAEKMVSSKLHNIDELGLNGFDRAHWIGGKGGFIDSIYYQSSNEKQFLLWIKSTNLMHKLSRGKPIEYIVNDKTRKYLPDYILDNKILFEVKSKYTMFGPNNSYLNTNIAKLKAAQKFGYIVYVVIDHKIELFEDFLTRVSCS